jgi:hypothetical protein
MFAQLLASARQRAGCSLEQISQQTKISTRYLEALEEGRVDVLPAGVYRRAIVRSYATSVGLDPEVAIDWFDRTFGAEAARRRVVEPPVPVAAAPRAFEEVLAAGQGFWASIHGSARTWYAIAAAVVSVMTLGGYVLLQSGPADPVGTAAAKAAPVRTRVVSSVASSQSSNTGFERASATPARGTSGDVALPTEVPAQTEPDADAIDHRLVVTSSPAGARVTVDGIGWGVTPLTIKYLPPGEKVIRVTKEGYGGREARVLVGGEQATANVRVTLRRRPE